MQPIVLGNVERGSQVSTDEWAGCWRMDNDYVHNVINHAECYVQGNVHTNTLENFWSLLKRGLNGTYISVEPFHLFRYIDEQAFRYNNRRHKNGEVVTDAERFSIAVSKIVRQAPHLCRAYRQDGRSEAELAVAVCPVVRSGRPDLSFRPAFPWVQIGLFLVLGFAPQYLGFRYGQYPLHRAREGVVLR
jgi:hypothetical protein